ncbi:MLO-like protein 6 [Tanacetum coccineum]
MAGATEGRSLEQTPTWALATVCFVLIAISIVVERSLHKIEQWFVKKHKRALFEALEKIKSELMLLGFISLLLTVGTTPITKICISESIASTWHPCSNQNEETLNNGEIGRRRRLLHWSDMGGSDRRVLTGSNSDSNKCAEKGKVSFMSYDGVHQLHIFIFALAVSHILNSILTIALGGLKMRSWKQWETEPKTAAYKSSHGKLYYFPMQDDGTLKYYVKISDALVCSYYVQESLGFGHAPVCFFRQFVRSVPKVDYLTLRHGFIIAHLAADTHSSFDFSKYINRSLEEDFKVVVGISPPIWLFAVAFLLLNTHGEDCASFTYNSFTDGFLIYGYPLSP